MITDFENSFAVGNSNVGNSNKLSTKQIIFVTSWKHRCATVWNKKTK